MRRPSRQTLGRVREGREAHGGAGAHGRGGRGQGRGPAESGRGRVSGLRWCARAVGLGEASRAAERDGCGEGAAAAGPLLGLWGSHVLLPVFVLVRRVDLADVIGAALVAKAAGAGARTIAVALGRPVDTVRGWLRRFEQRAEHVRVYFTVLLVDTGPDPIPPAASVSVFANAVSAVVGAWKAAASRWPDIGEVSPWQLAAATSRGRLLSPRWP
jgi:hypothetical protein